MQMIERTWREAAEVIIKDLRLFSSFVLAQFIVWRRLRRIRKEDALRRARLRLVH